MNSRLFIGFKKAFVTAFLIDFINGILGFLITVGFQFFFIFKEYPSLPYKILIDLDI